MRAKRYVIGAALVACAAAVAGCQKAAWIEGQWLLITPEGKPGVCHEFKRKERVLLIYGGPECSGNADTALSGKWQLKEENKLAVLQGTDAEARLVLITEKDREHFVARGAISGQLYRLGEKTAAQRLTQLEAEGVIKMRALPVVHGCRQLSMELQQIKALPTEPEPRMLRQKDQGLEYHVERDSRDPKVEKTVYALNQDVIEWVAFHLAPGAFQAPGPEALLEQEVGKPTESIATGAGENRQHIMMWRTYCPKLRGASNRDVDLTLFATSGKQRGTFYVSENVVSGIWEDLKRTVQDGEPIDENEGGGAASAGDQAPAAGGSKAADEGKAAGEGKAAAPPAQAPSPKPAATDDEI